MYLVSLIVKIIYFIILGDFNHNASRHACSVVSNSATLWTVAPQAPLSMGFSRQEYWSGLPFPSPGDLPDPKSLKKATRVKAELPC